jgi:ribonucleotide monophosphatase NagD (HAD superfamily)
MDLIYSTSYYVLNYNPISLGFNYLFPTSSSNYINNYQLIRKPKQDEISNYELIMIDMDGVLRNGNKKIGLADMVINKLNTLNQKYIIVTNECRNEPRQIRQELKTMNINIPEYVPIVSASQLVKKTLLKSIIGNNSKYINNKNKGSYNQKIGIIGTNNEYLYYKKSFKNYNNVRVYWISNNNLPTNLDYIVIGCIDNNDNLDKIFNKSLQWIMNNLDSTLIISCPDLQDIENKNKITYYLPIPFLKELETRVNSRDKSINFNSIYLESEKNKNFDYSAFKINHKQIIVGKPETDFIVDLLKYYKIIDKNINKTEDLPSLKDKVLMIGDNLNTDIKLSEKINCDAALLLSGVTSNDDLVNIHTSYNGNQLIESIKYIVPDLSQLFL